MKTMLMAVAALALGTAAQAEPIYVNGAPRVAHVSVADLNLDSDNGRITAQRRIRSAAATVCTADVTRDWADGLAVHACVDRAIAEGNRQLSHALAS